MPKFAKPVQIPSQFHPVAKFFHWVMAALILGMLALGWYMADLPFTPQKFTLIQLHKSFGILILIMFGIRLLVKLSSKAPPMPAHMSWWQKAAAHLTHFGLYYLMFTMPMTGYVMSDAAGYHPSFFGLQVPILSEPNQETAKFLNNLHSTFAWVFVALIAMHVAAALYHQLIVKDNLIARMAPSCKKLGAIAVLSLLPFTSHAMDWQVDPATSNLNWKATFNGQPVTGKFANWVGEISFDPQHLDTSKIKVTVDIASIASGDVNRDGTLKGADFFNTATNPKAVFESTKIVRTGTGSTGENYSAAGNLTIAGVTKFAAMPFTVLITGDKATSTGKLNLSRTAYGVGKGQWAKATEIADPVEVTFTVNATVKK